MLLVAIHCIDCIYTFTVSLYIVNENQTDINGEQRTLALAIVALRVFATSDL